MRVIGMAEEYVKKNRLQKGRYKVNKYTDKNTALNQYIRLAMFYIFVMLVYVEYEGKLKKLALTS